MTEGQRKYDMNSGVICAKDLPDDRYFAGAVVAMVDADGNYSTAFIPVSLDGVPADEVQETLGGMVATAFELANVDRRIVA
jgi:hypothetical protein